jgi:hypothetical protein
VEQLHVARARIAETETPRRWWQRGTRSQTEGGSTRAMAAVTLRTTGSPRR